MGRGRMGYRGMKNEDLEVGSFSYMGRLIYDYQLILNMAFNEFWL